MSIHNTNHINNEAMEFLTSNGWFDELDNTESVCRGIISSYHPSAKIPIIFRHYKHQISPIKFQIESSKQKMCKLYVYISGNLTFVTMKNIYTLKYADVFFARELEPNSTRVSFSTFIDFYQIDIPLEFFDLTGDSDFFKNVFYNRPLGSNNHLRMSEQEKNHLISKLERIETLINENTPSNSLPIYSYIIQVFQIINNNFNNNPNFELGNPSAPCVLKAIEYIQSNYKNIHSIDEISEACHVSTVYLSKMFKKFLGITLNSYIRQSRINYAKYLLRSGNSVTETCYNSGYNSYSYFIQEFKKYTGMTPLKYKQIKQNNNNIKD